LNSGRYFPGGKEGFIAEDLDLVIRKHGGKYSTDAMGRFSLIEVKHGGCSIKDCIADEIGFSKEMTFGMIDRLLRKGDPEAKRYEGFFIIRTFKNPEWSKHDTIFNVNSKHVCREDFFKWLNGDLYIKPYTFPFSSYALDNFIG